METLGEILRGKFVDSFKCKDEDLVNDAVFHGEPMKLLQDRCYVTDGGGSGNVSGQQSFGLAVIYGWICQVNHREESCNNLVGR